MIPQKTLKKSYKKGIIKKRIRRVHTTPELLKKIVKNNIRDGYIFNYEDSKLTPCSCCGSIELYFIKK